MKATAKVAGVAVHSAGIVVIAGVAAYYENQGNPLWITIPDNLVGVGFVAAGLVARERRRLDRSGRLMLVVGYTWYLGNLNVIPVLSRIAFWMMQWNKLFLVLLLLTYPTGTTRRRIERWGIIATGVVLFFGMGAAALTFDPHAYFGYSDYYPGPVLLSNPHVFFGIIDTLNYCFAALTLLLAYLLSDRWRHSSPALRRALAPLWVAGLLATGSFLSTQATMAFQLSDRAANVTNAVSLYAQLLIPVSFLVGLLRVSRSRAVVADLVVRLEENPDPIFLQPALAHALGDPSLEIGFWSADRATYLHSDGTVLDELPSGDTDRGITYIGDDEAPHAVLIHHRELLEQRPLLRSVGAAARLVLENARLQADLRAQLIELRASRARIVAAALEERRRVERDLHDGAQQRLLALGITVAMLRDELAEPAQRPGATELLDEAAQEVAATIAELRELARGIHPAVLTEQGLAAAATTLAERCPVPITLDIPSCRWPPVVESTAYFVISEALANVTKHANASSVTVRVRPHGDAVVLDVIDDGVGGARLDGTGSGLRGIADRVNSVEGRLVLDSGGGGTHLTVELPCGS